MVGDAGPPEHLRGDIAQAPEHDGSRGLQSVHGIVKFLDLGPHLQAIRLIHDIANRLRHAGARRKVGKALTPSAIRSVVCPPLDEVAVADGHERLDDLVHQIAASA